MDTKWRLFVAAWPPPDVAAAMLGTLAGVTHPDARTTPARNLHLTLHFVGAVASRSAASIAETVEHATHGIRAFALAPQRLVTFPARGPARLIALETDAPAPVLELHRRLVNRLAREPSRDGRPYRPHFTLCRFRSPTAGYRLDHACELPPFDVGQVDLVRSELRPDGACYHVVESFRLGPGA